MPQSTTTGVVVEIKADMEFLNAAGKAYKGTRFTYSDDRSGDIKAQKFHEKYIFFLVRLLCLIFLFLRMLIIDELLVLRY